MTAIKKTTAKSSSKSLAPAMKSAPVATKKVVPAAPVRPPAASPVPKVKTVATKAVTTTITAKIDVGFGNALYVRGEGPGLNWERGVLMACVGVDAWAITLGESARAYTLKFLINDVTWSAGPDFHVASGAQVTFSPGF